MLKPEEIVMAMKNEQIVSKKKRAVSGNLAVERVLRGQEWRTRFKNC